MLQSHSSLMWACLYLLVAVVLVGEACIYSPRRHRQLLYHKPLAVPPTQDPAKINCLIDVCYLSLDHPQLCEKTLNTLRSRNAMEPCSDTCAANATGAECQHHTVIMYLLDRYDGLSCGQKWESTFWGVDPTTAPTTKQPPFTSTWTTAPPQPRAQNSFHPNSGSLRVSKDPREHEDAALASAQQPHLYEYVINKDQITPEYEPPFQMTNSMEKTQGSHLRDGNVFWLVVHGKRPLLPLIGNINNPLLPLKQTDLSDNDPSSAKPPSPFILGQHLRPLIVVVTSATRNPLATHHGPPARDRSEDEATEQHPQLQAGDTEDSAWGNRVDVRARKVTKTRIEIPERETAGVTDVRRLNSNEGPKMPRDDTPSSSGRISELAEKNILHMKSPLSLKAPGTTPEKNNVLPGDQRRSGQRKRVSHQTNVLIRNNHTGRLETGGSSLMLWVVASLMSVVLMAVCGGLITFACIALNHARRASYDLQ